MSVLDERVFCSLLDRLLDVRSESAGAGSSDIKAALRDFQDLLGKARVLDRTPKDLSNLTMFTSVSGLRLLGLQSPSGMKVIYGKIASECRDTLRFIA